MATISSVLGPMDTADLGFTLPHEHLIDSSAGIRNTYYELEFRTISDNDAIFPYAVKGVEI